MCSPHFVLLLRFVFCIIPSVLLSHSFFTLASFCLQLFCSFSLFIVIMIFCCLLVIVVCLLLCIVVWRWRARILCLACSSVPSLFIFLPFRRSLYAPLCALRVLRWRLLRWCVYVLVVLVVATLATLATIASARLWWWQQASSEQRTASSGQPKARQRWLASWMAR